MSKKIYIVGKTSPQEVCVVSAEREFVLDEYLIVEDSNSKDLVCEVLETYSYPSVDTDTFSHESGLFNSLKNQSIDINKTLHVAKLKVLEEVYSPIQVGCNVREPEFGDLEKLLIRTTTDNGFTLGVIKGTENLQNKLPAQFFNIAPLYNSSTGIIPQQGIPFIFDYYAVKEYPGIGLFGNSGSGKSFTVRVFCEEIMQKRVPAVIFDPHYEFDFTNTAKNIPDSMKANYNNKHEMFQVGVNVGINFVDLNTDELISLMEFVADVSQPMRSAVEELHQKNDSFTSLINRVEKLKMAFENQDKSEHERDILPEEIVLLYAKHKNKIAGTTTLQAVAWRLDQLNKTGIFGHDITLVELCMLKRKLAIIRGDLKLLKMFASYVIKKLYRKRRAYRDWAQSLNDDMKYQPQKFPPFFIILDEAHHFAPNSNYINPTKSILREIGQEARKYGVFLILGTQRPALLDSTLTAQLNTKIVFRTGIESDMQMIKMETNLSPKQVSRLPELTSGNAFVSSAILSKTLYVRFRATKTQSPHSNHPFDELDGFNSNDKLKSALLDYLPFSEEKLPRCHAEINKKVGRVVALSEILEVLDEMAEQQEIKREHSPFGNIYDKL